MRAQKLQSQILKQTRFWEFFIPFRQRNSLACFECRDLHNNDNTPIQCGIIYSSLFFLSALAVDSLAFSSTFPPYLCKSFHSIQFVKEESELLLALIKVVLSFNPDFIVEYEVEL